MSALHAADLRLARDASELRGLRAARWIRESTPGQLDRWGPPSQRRMQDTAIAALGLADTGLAWTVGRSGWSGPDSMDDPPATRTPEFRAMLAAAEAGAFDVLLVGYTARYMRDLALALSYRRWFHRQGVVVYICDDRILSSNPADWERFVDKCKAAEINSREQSRNVRAGYAAKRDTHGDPGGHPPFGFRRSGEAKVVEIDPERIATAVRAYALAATGLTDREVAGRLGLGLHTLRGILTSPLYRGRLRDGSAANWDAVVDEETWRRVADLRAARNRRSPGPARDAPDLCPADARVRRLRPPARRRQGPLPPPRGVCGVHGRPSCGRRGPRTPRADPGPELRARRVRGDRAVRPGAGPPGRARRGGRCGCLCRGAGTEPNQLRLARIEEERERALATYRRDRDPHVLEQTMRELDAAEAEASGGSERPTLPPDEVRRYLENLPAWWADADPDDRRALADDALRAHPRARGQRGETGTDAGSAGPRPRRGLWT